MGFDEAGDTAQVLGSHCWDAVRAKPRLLPARSVALRAHTNRSRKHFVNEITVDVWEHVSPTSPSQQTVDCFFATRGSATCRFISRLHPQAYAGGLYGEGLLWGHAYKPGA